MVTLNEIRKRLVDSIKASEFTQKEIAERLNIKPATVSQYISGRAMPALDTFANLCELLDVSTDNILLNK